jgi:glycosyltransferase involved in cell wall biosynthesis
MALRPLMVISAPVATRSGYGAHARDIVHSLININKWDIVVVPQRWGDTPPTALNPNNELDKKIIDRLIKANITTQPDIWIQITVPNEFQRNGKFNIGITAGIETTLPHQDLINGLNRMDLNIVPSKFTKQVFEQVAYEIRNEQQVKRGDLKLEKPMEVIFEGADETIYGERELDLTSSLTKQLKNTIEDSFCFLYVGHWLSGEIGQDRKDVGMMIKTFLETFKDLADAPALVLKANAVSYSVTDRYSIVSKIETIKKSISAKKLPNIYLVHGDLTDQEMNELYNHPKIKAMVSFTKGEGFGRPLLEFSFVGKPIIASNWSGHLDFLDGGYVQLLPGALTPVHPSSFMGNLLIQGANWFTVNYEYASSILKNTYKSAMYKMLHENAQTLMKKNKEKFTLKKMQDKFEEVMKKYVPEQKAIDLSALKMPTGQFKLPTLKKISPLNESHVSSSDSVIKV